MHAKLLRRERRLLLAFNAVPAAAFVWACAGPPLGVPAVNAAAFVAMYVVQNAGFELGFHRYLAHQAFAAGPVLRTALVIAGSMTAAGPPVAFVATHRHHHAHSDEPEDVHSPHARGAGLRRRLTAFGHAHLGWIFDARRVSVGYYARDLLADGWLVRLDGLYLLWVLAGLAVPAAVAGLVTGTAGGAAGGFLWGGLVRVFLGQQSIYAVNSLCHGWGTRPFASDDASTNNAWLVLPTLGASLHNSHHAFPSTATNALLPGQVDPLGWLVAGLERLGLARDVKRPSAASIARLRRPPSGLAAVGDGEGGS